MKSSIRLVRIAGIDIGIHYSWILIFILFATLLALSFFPGVVPNQSQAAYWTAGIVAALLLFLAVLVHELAHSLVAQAKGMKVNSITLFIFGGVSNLEGEPEKPGTEFIMAIVGPVTSLVLAFIFWIVFKALEPGASFFNFPSMSAHHDSLIIAIFYYLAYVNALLAVFNILPGFPLDGGRVLRSIIWGTTGNLIRATNIATMVGRLFGWAFIAFGVFEILFIHDIFSGIWIAFIGWFLANAAETSRQETTLREHLSGVKVKDAMLQSQESISPTATVDELVKGVFSRRYNRAVPVCDSNRTVGIVTISDVKGLPQEKWTTTLVQDIMTREPLYTVGPEDDLNQAMKLLAQHDLNQVLVITDGQCAGLLSRAEIIRYLQLTQELRIKGKH